MSNKLTMSNKSQQIKKETQQIKKDTKKELEILGIKCIEILEKYMDLYQTDHIKYKKIMELITLFYSMLYYLKNNAEIQVKYLSTYKENVVVLNNNDKQTLKLYTQQLLDYVLKA
jgi:hypothetical protein